MTLLNGSRLNLLGSTFWVSVGRGYAGGMSWRIDPHPLREGSLASRAVSGGVQRRRADVRGRWRGNVLPPMSPGAERRNQRVEQIMWEVVDRLFETWADELQGINFAVRTAPTSASLERATARGETVPLGVASVRQERRNPHRSTRHVVLFRRPIETSAVDEHHLAHIVADVVIELVSEFLNVPPEEIDPIYGTGPHR